MPDLLSDDLIQAAPDLTLLVRSDGNILGRFGGRELDSRAGAKGSEARTLEEMWSADVAHRLRQLARHALKDRTPLDRKYRDADGYYEVRVRPQGIDRVLMVFRELANDDAIDIIPESGSVQALATRGQLMRVLSLAVSEARLREQPLALITIYLGGLTDIERAFGVTVGEQLVSAAAERLHTFISRQKAEATKRRPGETVFLASISDHALAAVIERAPARDELHKIVMAIREALAQPFDLLGRKLSITPVFGIALAPEDSTQARELLNCARSAMHDAHCSGHSISFHSHTLRLRALNRLDGEYELRWALEHEQFQLRYRPLDALSAERPIAFQAQPCWTHPVRGPVAAGEFLALAETSEIARDIGRWMMSKALTDLGSATHVAAYAIVTLCKRHVLSESLLADVMHSAAGADARRLALRISERVLTCSSELLPRLHDLRSAGVQVIVERFGAGHILMERVAELPVDTVILEPMLLCNLEVDDRMRRVCRSVIDVAHALGWQVAADEVGSPKDLELLRELGCDFAGRGLPRTTRDQYQPLDSEAATDI